MRKSNSEFSVVISQMNGQDYASRSHVFTVGKTRIKLSRGWITKARELYSTSMQLCGVRGNIKAPTKAVFWQPRKSLTFILTFESEHERNAAIALARKYAFDCSVSKSSQNVAFLRLCKSLWFCTLYSFKTAGLHNRLA
jgi:hypothetical protein